MTPRDRFVLALQGLVRAGGSIQDAEECAMAVDAMIIDALMDDGLPLDEDLGLHKQWPCHRPDNPDKE